MQSCDVVQFLSIYSRRVVVNRAVIRKEQVEPPTRAGRRGRKSHRMTAQLASIPHLSVQSADGIVHIRDLASADPDLLALVTGASDPEAVVQRVLSTGVRALVVSQVSVDTAVVETSFAALETQLRTMLKTQPHALLVRLLSCWTIPNAESVRRSARGRLRSARYWSRHSIHSTAAARSASLTSSYETLRSGSCQQRVGCSIQTPKTVRYRANGRRPRPSCDRTRRGRTARGAGRDG